MEYIIETKDLTKRFKNQSVVKSLNLTVPAGSIFAFLGPNGAGKTTTMKMILNMIKADSGQAKVFDIPSPQLGPEEFSKIGYVSEGQEIPSWMTVEQFLNYCRRFYPSWDSDFCENLLAAFDLPVIAKIADLSRGMRMKLLLISSIAYRPSLLILDEPFSGLDPVVREQVITGILDMTENERWTIFMSTHDLEEVERLADRVGIIHNGEMVLMEEITQLQNRFRKVTLFAEQPWSQTISIPQHWLSVEIKERFLNFIEEQYQSQKSEQDYRVQFPAIKDITTANLSLRDIFIAIAKEHSIRGLAEAPSCPR